MKGKWETGDQQFLFPEELKVRDITTDVDLVKHLLTEPRRSMNGSLTTVALNNILIDVGKCREVVRALKNHIVALERYLDVRQEADDAVAACAEGSTGDVLVDEGTFERWMASHSTRPQLSGLRRAYCVTFTPEEIIQSGESVQSEAAIPQTDLVAKQMGATDVVQGC